MTYAPTYYINIHNRLQTKQDKLVILIINKIINLIKLTQCLDIIIVSIRLMVVGWYNFPRWRLELEHSV